MEGALPGESVLVGSEQVSLTSPPLLHGGTQPSRCFPSFLLLRPPNPCRKGGPCAGGHLAMCAGVPAVPCVAVHVVEPAFVVIELLELGLAKTEK